MSWRQKYEKWANYADLDLNLRAQMNKMNESELEECFAKDLEFGTGGMRGILGPGTNRLNIYIVRKASYGFAQYLKTFKADDRGVVIAHDNRHQSVEFALETAKVFASLGIKAYLFNSLRPTPTLSFAVRYLNAIGGVMITASHNPKEYNGYKIYDSDGCQLSPVAADMVIEEINKVTDIFNVETEKNSSLITYLDSKVDEAYIDAVETVTINKNLKKNFKIVYTPLHGTGSVYAVNLLSKAGYDVTPVLSQMINDPDFSATKNANPEEKGAFEEAIKLGESIDASLLIATDPDADRVGLACKHNDEYYLLNGNQTGALMVHYILSTRKALGTLPKNGWLFTTIVSSNLGVKIAESFGINTKLVLTGFKFIGEQAKLLENTDGEYVFGYEESYGYLPKDFVRDKDAMQASLLACEIAAYYHEKNMTLVDALEEIYKKYGYYLEGLANISLKGLAGAEKIKEIMNYFRNNDIVVKNEEIVSKSDYQLGIKFMNGSKTDIDLPKSNVIKYDLSSESWFILRPSGTEPKLKVYFGVKGTSKADVDAKIETLKINVLEIVNNI